MPRPTATAHTELMRFNCIPGPPYANVQARPSEVSGNAASIRTVGG